VRIPLPDRHSGGWVTAVDVPLVTDIVGRDTESVGGTGGDGIHQFDAAVAVEHDQLPGDLRSRGLDAFRRHVEDYVQSRAFLTLENAIKEIKRDLSEIEYALFIGNSSATVRKFESESDYGAAVAATFERFKQGAVKDYEFKIADFFEMNHVEAFRRAGNERPPPVITSARRFRRSLCNGS
jgi:hypothetical protein